MFLFREADRLGAGPRLGHGAAVELHGGRGRTRSRASGVGCAAASWHPVLTWTGGGHRRARQVIGVARMRIHAILRPMRMADGLRLCGANATCIRKRDMPSRPRRDMREMTVPASTGIRRPRMPVVPAPGATAAGRCRAKMPAAVGRHRTLSSGTRARGVGTPPVTGTLAAAQPSAGLAPPRACTYCCHSVATSWPARSRHNAGV